MAEMSIDDIVAVVTRKVMEALDGKQCTQTAGEDNSKQKKILLIGDPVSLPEGFTDNAAVFDIKDFETERNVLKYNEVVITRLSLLQLADAAMGRPTDSVCCAVIYALLNGVGVTITGKAFSHRKYSGKGSSFFYNIYEEYVKKLQIGGVRIIDCCTQLKVRESLPEKKVSEPAGRAVPVLPPMDSRLVTEAEALKIAAGAKDEVCFPSDAILTPLARDVFTRAKLRIVFR